MSSYTKLLDEYANQIQRRLDERTLMLISALKMDLNYGPVTDNPDYPGFEPAIKEIGRSLKYVIPSTVYVSIDMGEILESRPPIEDSYLYAEVDRRTIYRHLLGAEVSNYISPAL